MRGHVHLINGVPTVCRALVRASALSTYLAFQRLISSDDAAVARRRVMVARRPIFLLREREKEACYSLVMRLNYKVVLWILLTRSPYYPIR
jgi:hypothetical protein